MRFAVVGSGSKGNAIVVESGETRVLIDCGFAPRALRDRLKSLDLTLQSLDAVFLTHGHGDHVRGADAVTRALRRAVFATEPTRRMLARQGGLGNFAAIEPGAPVTLGGLTITPFAISHDAPGAVGYVLEDDTARLGLCTDLGASSPAVEAALKDCTSLYLEFNHDERMLKDGPYPLRLKQRILARTGHLSNDDAAALLARVVGPNLDRLLLAHLSEVNNTPALALAAARTVVDGRDIDVAVAPQHHPTVWLRARRQAAQPRPPVPPRTTPLERKHPGTAALVPSRKPGLDRQLSLFGGPS